MFSKLRIRFIQNPTLYYAMSIAATWAGVGSLMNGITMVQTYGIVPFLIWALGNTLACVVFGIFAPAIPKLRDVFRSRAMRVIAGLMSIFQIWLSMNGIQAIFADTVLGGRFGMALAYASAAFFLLLLVRFGMLRNVLTDHMSWSAVYGVALLLTACAIIHSQGSMNPLAWGVDEANLTTGINKAALLLPGAFLYPYFFEILDYNDKNKDGTKKVNIRRAFALGGFLFGAYLAFPLLLAWTSFSPALNIIKAILVTLVAVSTLSSFLYSVYITFGRKLGLAVNLASVALWQLLIPLGVMGVWTLMSTIRIYIVAGAILTALIWHTAARRRAAAV
ncbi:MAG: hypothetical protein HFF08_07125 [Oscillospiraceae bacterium]|nr:hypothetical protein [Oscillospiraceae bacterium]